MTQPSDQRQLDTTTYTITYAGGSPHGPRASVQLSRARKQEHAGGPAMALSTRSARTWFNDALQRRDRDHQDWAADPPRHLHAQLRAAEIARWCQRRVAAAPVSRERRAD
jgi:hypothetical protein